MVLAKNGNLSIITVNFVTFEISLFDEIKFYWGLFRGL